MSVSSRLGARATLGRSSEDLACRMLRSRGYRIVERNVRVAGAEIDIVARIRGVTVFIEVRSRTNQDRGSALATIGREKRSRLVRAAAGYLAREGLSDTPVRFDAVGVDWREGSPSMTLVRSAFDSGD